MPLWFYFRSKGARMIEFGRDLCGDAENALRREWLVTNGPGRLCVWDADGREYALLSRRIECGAGRASVERGRSAAAVDAVDGGAVSSQFL